MTETARQDLLEKRRNAYHMRTSARAHANKDEHEASTSSANEQLGVGTAIFLPDQSGKKALILTVIMQ
ncbi:hypothetical protein MKW92_033212 [Papaver armeniacum]|nr:hypothetical protein MKW92_033212 [Papaver armeniacum]